MIKELLKSLKQILTDRLECQIKMEENPVFKDAYLSYWFKLSSEEIKVTSATNKKC